MRSRLLAAAFELFEAQGFGTTTIDQIAERADVTRQTVLNHYPAKKDFVAAWGEHRRNELAAMDAASTGSARDGLRRVMNLLAEINMREKRLTQQLREQQIAPQPVPDAVLRILRKGQRTGEIDGSVDPQVAAELVAAVYFDTLSRWPDQRPARIRLAPSAERQARPAAERTRSGLTRLKSLVLQVSPLCPVLESTSCDRTWIRLYASYLLDSCPGTRDDRSSGAPPGVVSSND
jgi:AcrR family transcriptional regulator